MKASFLLFFFIFVSTISFSQAPYQYPQYYGDHEPSTLLWGDRNYEKKSNWHWRIDA